MPLFDIPSRSGKKDDMRIASKSKAKKPARPASRANNLSAKIEHARQVVSETLGKYKDEYIVITTRNELWEYVELCLRAGAVAIDTETTGLDPMQCKIVGVCLYAPNIKPAYVPINHISYITGERVENQVSEKDARECLERLAMLDRIIMFNAKFDIRVLRNTLGVYLTCWWDAYLASRLMNENEPHKGLKALHQKYVLNGADDEFSFDEIFKGVNASHVPIDVFYLYAAHDAIATYELYQFQEHWLRYDHQREDMRNLAWVFHNIEMPCVEVVCDMEDTGIELDINYARELSERYHARLESSLATFYEILDKYTKKIETYLKTHKNVKIDDPINIASSSQIAVLLYDIFETEPVDRKSPRGTGEAILLKIADTYDDGRRDICNAILEYRGIAKLISTYIDKLPECVNPSDGRIHCSFNQYGADTGRFSSSDPNLQNIPSHNKEIRKMFVATNEEKLVSTDTQQFVVDRWCEVECADKWKYADKIMSGDILLLDDGSCVNVCGVNVNQDTVVIDFT